MRSTIHRSVVTTALLIGAILRTVQYGARTSLSSDEAALALNVMDRGWRDLLFQPLMHDQVAPAGFLFLEKASVAIVGTGEVAFRLFPYLFSIVSLVLFWRVSRRYLRTPAMLAALIVFAISPILVLYAGTAKQYSGDIAVTLFLLSMTLWYRDEPTGYAHAAVVGIAGGGALLLSHPGVLVAFGLGALLVVDGQQGRKPAGQLVAISAGWMVGAAIVTYISLTAVSSLTTEYMEQYWQQGFMPPLWVGKEELLWIPVQLARMTSWFVPGIPNPRLLPEVVLAAYALLLLLGILDLMKRESKNAVFLAVPVIVAIIAAAVRLLPMAGRVSLFIAPTLLIGCFAGLDRIGAWLSQRLGTLPHTATLGLAILSTLAFLARTPPPMLMGQTKPALQEVKAHWALGDQLVVSRGRWTLVMVEYYERRLLLGGWTHIDRLEGAHTEEQVLRGYLRGVDAFRGVPRVWFHLEGTAACEDEAILGYLTAIGKRLHSVDYRQNVGETVYVRLYDLSDAEFLGRADADTYRLPKCTVPIPGIPSGPLPRADP
jgi:hypothetical protein